MSGCTDGILLHQRTKSPKNPHGRFGSQADLPGATSRADSEFRFQISNQHILPKSRFSVFPKRWRSTEAENLIGRFSPHRIGNLFRATNKFGNLLSTSRFWFSRKQIHKLRRIYKTGQIFFKIFFVYNVIMWADSRFLWEQIPEDNFLCPRLS